MLSCGHSDKFVIFDFVFCVKIDKEKIIKINETYEVKTIFVASWCFSRQITRISGFKTAHFLIFQKRLVCPPIAWLWNEGISRHVGVVQKIRHFQKMGSPNYETCAISRHISDKWGFQNLLTTTRFYVRYVSGTVVSCALFSNQKLDQKIDSFRRNSKLPISNCDRQTACMEIWKPMLKVEISFTSHTAHATQQVGRKRINNTRSSILSTIMVI